MYEGIACTLTGLCEETHACLRDDQPALTIDADTCTYALSTQTSIRACLGEVEGGKQQYPISQFENLLWERLRTHDVPYGFKVPLGSVKFAEIRYEPRLLEGCSYVVFRVLGITYILGACDEVIESLRIEDASDKVAHLHPTKKTGRLRSWYGPVRCKVRNCRGTHFQNLDVSKHCILKLSLTYPPMVKILSDSPQ